PFRAGFGRIVRASRAPISILPETICYDVMTAGRTRCFINIGREFPLDRSRSRRDLEDQVRTTLLRLMTIHAGHLAVAALRKMGTGTTFLGAELEQSMLAEARR